MHHQKLIINGTGRETRVALLENNKVVEFLLESSQSKGIVGNIYKGKVVNVLPGMQAAFIDIGLEKNAFLYVQDAYFSKGIIREKEQGNLPKINQVVKVGEEILVQVNKEPVGTKGARVTTNIALPGKYLVYLPYGGHVGLSRRIEQAEERERLKSMAASVLVEQEGLIIRTACQEKKEEEVIGDIQALKKLWTDIRAKAKNSSAPLIHEELEIVSKIVRDFMSVDIKECIVDNSYQYRRLLQELESLPQLKERVTYYQGVQNVFDYYQVTVELERALKRKVWLKSGGYIIIDHTEALTSIDVNTGKFIGSSNLAETVYRTNIEAAKEIARQLRLRDLGGIIIIDFIDMHTSEHQHEVLKTLEEAIKYDRTRAHVVGLTSLGLVEMTRKETGSLHEVMNTACPCCEGKGFVLSEEHAAAQLERMLLEYRTNEFEAILVQAHPKVIKAFQDDSPQGITELEQKCGFKIYLQENNRLTLEQSSILFTGREEEVRLKYEK